MRKHKKLGAILAACAMSAVMACTALTPCVSAAETAQDPAEIQQYNLAGEDWDQLLAQGSTAEEDTPAAAAEVSSAAEDTTGGWKGNAASDGGMSKLLIIAIIAFALGGIGVAFFIYSQFIYKAKLKRKLAAKQEEPKEVLPQEKTHTQKVNDFFAEIEKETRLSDTPKNMPSEPKKPAAPSAPNALSKEDEKKLNSVNWDDFFNNH